MVKIGLVHDRNGGKRSTLIDSQSGKDIDDLEGREKKKNGTKGLKDS